MALKICFHELREKLAFVFLLLALIQTFVYATLDFLEYRTYMGIVEVLTVPLIALYYIFKTEFFDIAFFGILLLIFAGDYSNTFIEGYDDLSIIAYAIAMFYYSYLILRRIREFSLKAIVKVLLPFLAVYISVFVWFISNHMDISNAIILYNIALGVFSVFALKGFMLNRSTDNNLLFFAAICVCLLTIFYGYVNFVSPNKFLMSYGLNIPFTLFHSLMAVYIVRTEAVMYRYKAILKADKK